MVYWSAQYPPDKEAGDRFVLVLDDSKWHEELTADWLRKIYTLHSEQMGVDIFRLDFLPSEPKFFCKTCRKWLPGNMLHGHIDGILQELFEPDLEYLYEHKAINHFTFNRYWNGDVPVDYLTQSCLYFKGLKSLMPHLNRGILLIKNKNTSQYIDYYFIYDEQTDVCTITEIEHSSGEIKTSPIILKDILSDVADKFYAIYQNTIDRTLPVRPYLPNTEFPCGYCNWEPTCWDGYEGDFGNSAAALPEEYGYKSSRYLEITAEMKDLKEEKESLRSEFLRALTELKTTVGTIRHYKAIMTIKTKEDGGISQSFTIKRIKKET